jgi:DNA-binding NarL/FixJ family response regulator
MELTKRQAEVLEQVRLGKTDKQIGKALGISQETVKTHLRVLFARFSVHNRTALAMVDYD